MSDDENDDENNFMYNIDTDALDQLKGSNYGSELGSRYSGNQPSQARLRSDVSNINGKMEQYNDQLTELDSKIDRYNEETSALASALGSFGSDIEDAEEHLDDMRETLESRELNIYLVPPDTDISRLSLQVQIVVAAFVLAIALGRYVIPNSPFTYIGIALSLSILVNLITRSVYPIRHSE